MSSHIPRQARFSVWKLSEDRQHRFPYPSYPLQPALELLDKVPVCAPIGHVVFMKKKWLTPRWLKKSKTLLPSLYHFQLLFTTLFLLLMLSLSKGSSLIPCCLSSPETEQFLFLRTTSSSSLSFPQLFKEDGLPRFQKHQDSSVKKVWKLSLGCFHFKPMNLKKMSQSFQNKFDKPEIEVEDN